MKSVAAAVRLRLINEPEGHVFLCQPGLFPEMIQPLLTNDAIPRNQEISVAKKRCAFLTRDDSDAWSINFDLSFEPMPANARCDFLRGPDGRLLLMELELTEPSLYLRMDGDAPRRFARAFDAHVARLRASS